MLNIAGYGNVRIDISLVLKYHQSHAVKLSGHFFEVKSHCTKFTYATRYNNIETALRHYINEITTFECTEIKSAIASSLHAQLNGKTTDLMEQHLANLTQEEEKLIHADETIKFIGWPDLEIEHKTVALDSE